MKKLIQSLVFFLIVAIASSGFCQIRPGTYSISPFVGNYAFEGNQSLESKPFYGLRVGYDFTKHLGAELVFDHVATKYTGATNKINTDVFNYRLEGLYHFMPESNFVPFIAVGAGGQSVNYESGPQNKSRLAADYGYGIKYFVTDWFAFRVDIRHVLAFDSVYNNMEIAAGLSILFGGTKPAPAAVVKEPEPEPATMVKEPEAAPVVAVVEERKKEPEAAPVVEDAEQKKEAEAVAAVAKEIIEKGRATINVKFDFDKAEIKPAFHQEIKKFAGVLNKYPELKIVIEGHTDNIGGKKYNQKLSMKRAESVKNYLIKKFGINDSRLKAKGYGESKPIADNKTAAGRHKNRRVEAVVDYIIKK